MFSKTIVLALCFFLLAQQTLANNLLRDAMKPKRGDEELTIERDRRVSTITNFVCSLPVIGGLSSAMCPTASPPPPSTGSLGSITDLIDKLTGSLTGGSGGGSGSNGGGGTGGGSSGSGAAPAPAA